MRNSENLTNQAATATTAQLREEAATAMCSISSNSSNSNKTMPTSRRPRALRAKTTTWSLTRLKTILMSRTVAQAILTQLRTAEAPNNWSKLTQEATTKAEAGTSKSPSSRPPKVGSKACLQMPRRYPRVSCLPLRLLVSNKISSTTRDRATSLHKTRSQWLLLTFITEWVECRRKWEPLLTKRTMMRMSRMTMPRLSSSNTSLDNRWWLKALSGRISER